MKIKLLYISILLIGIIFTSCKKDSTTPSLTGKTFVVKALSETNWVYFSFDKGDSISVTDPANSTDWDLAFERYKIKTNSGKSGKGLGGVFDSGKTNQSGFDSLTLVPSTAVFAVDDSVTVYGYDIVKNVPTVDEEVMSNLFYGAFAQQHSATTTLLVSRNQIFIVKTAKGNYAKMWLKSYYNDLDGTTGGYDKFTYTYQPDGSKNLK